MKKWQYKKYVSTGDITSDELMVLGGQGWELCAVTRLNRTQKTNIFKRELPNV